ncbi:hypothetical protein HGRIS_001720 [Hohenbuehelia grisea]|uniref:3-ketoacyl-CoA thiolase n=1 Tax=Hohenbuehelia grisea TaxID=104357 RepID=A0ABR3JK03_9AGAR
MMLTTGSITSPAKTRLLEKHEDDVVIVCAVRSAMTKGNRGGFKDTCAEELLSAVLRAAYTKAGLDPALIEDVAVGNCRAPGAGAGTSRMAALHAGIPHTAAVNAVNRACSSGLSAVNQIASEIHIGQIDIGIGAGVESMSQNYGPPPPPENFSPSVLSNAEARDCLIPMGITSENVAEDYGITRQVQDKFAATSYQKAAAAQKAGKFKDEIVPVSVKVADPKSGSERTVVIDTDEGIRDGVTAESLAKLKPAFKSNGASHAGNSSQVSDGAAAVVLARRSVAKRLGLPIIGKFVLAATVGVPPRIMGVGPAYAIPKALEKAGIKTDDVDFFEINEAFASQAIFSIDKAGIPYEKVNVHGGAIALGHPLGCTGARQIATGMNIAKQYGAKVFVTSMCMGTGMGMAAIFVNEQ